MFLNAVWKHSKLLFLFMGLFISAQLFVAYNRGMLFTPFFNTWMYSDHYTQSDSFPVLEIYGGGKMVAAADYSPRKWDKLMLGYDYSSDPGPNWRVYGEIRRLTSTFIGHPFGIAPFYNELDSSELRKRWLALAQKVTGGEIDSVVVGNYRWNGKKLARQ
jgi:hypothetical protein